MKAITSEVPAEITVAKGAGWYDLDGVTRLATASTALSWRASPWASGPQRAMYATIAGVRRVVLVKPLSVRPVPAEDADEAYNDGLAAATKAVTAIPRK
jgi:hypothetical protein